MNDEILTFRRMEQFTDYLFNNRDEARKAALILKAILEARSPRLSDISQALPGNHPTFYDEEGTALLLTPGGRGARNEDFTLGSSSC